MPADLLRATEPAGIAAVAGIVAVCAWRPDPFAAALLGLLCLVVTRRWRTALVCTVLVVMVTIRSTASRDGLVPDALGPYAGWATVAADPDPSPRSIRVVLRIEGERFETWVHGRASRLRVEEWRQGDVVWIEGVRRELDAGRSQRVAWQHVVGELEADVRGDRLRGARLATAANRVRSLIADGVSVLDDDGAALARGLIIGDDSEQSEAMTQRFRESGLSHLTAVSGQNVALALAIVGPLLRRARPAVRLAATLAVIAWFVVLTRAEPSVLRAGMMAALSAVAFATGSEDEPVRLLGVAVIVLVLVDPLLVGSIGFWLSVGATAGVTVIGPPLRRRWSSLGPLATPVAMTTGAQLGVAVPSVLVFGPPPLIGTVANLVAVPVAGLVMLYGLPASLLAGAVESLRRPLMAPVALGVRWVDGVAAVAAGLERRPPWNLAVTVAVLGLGVAAARRWSPSRVDHGG